MNCNKCGTPILPGEKACRFCGNVGDFSVRIYEEIKPEIIDFTTGNDDIIIIEDDSEDVVEVKETTPIAPVLNEEVSYIEVPVEEKRIAPSIDSIDLTATLTLPIVTPITSEPSNVAPVVKEEVIDNEVVTDEVINSSDVLSSSEIVLDEVTAEKPSLVSQSTPIVITKTDSRKEKQEIIEEVLASANPNPVTEKVKVKKESKVSIIFIIVLVLLLASISLNVYLFLNKETKVEKEVVTTDISGFRVVSLNERKISIPSDWAANYTSQNNYFSLNDSTKNWNATVSVASGVNFKDINTEKSISDITASFGSSKYLFTSDYTKTVDGKDFYIFKGKYYDYSVYIITTSLDNTNTIVADLKFKGEVSETVIGNLLTALSTMKAESMSDFYSANFDFNDITNLIVDNTTKSTNN